MKQGPSTRRCLWGGILLLLLPTSSVLAQDPRAATPDSEVITLEPVVVSVQKRPEQEHAVPMALSTWSARDLDVLRIRSARDAVALTPGAVLTQANGVNTLTLRGIGGGGRNIGFDPRVGIYLDGVYLGPAQALVLPWDDIEQAVVLRGPQGHWFGRNSVAGAIALTTRPPSGLRERQVSGGLTGDGGWSAGGMAADTWRGLACHGAS